MTNRLASVLSRMAVPVDLFGPGRNAERLKRYSNKCPGCGASLPLGTGEEMPAARVLAIHVMANPDCIGGFHEIRCVAHFRCVCRHEYIEVRDGRSYHCIAGVRLSDGRIVKERVR